MDRVIDQRFNGGSRQNFYIVVVMVLLPVISTAIILMENRYLLKKHRQDRSIYLYSLELR